MKFGIYYPYWEQEWSADCLKYVDKAARLGFDILEIAAQHLNAYSPELIADIARSANITNIQVIPAGNDWEAALRDVRAVIADAQAEPPTQAEIDREIAEIESSFKQRIATAPVEAGAKIADDLAEAVDINDVMRDLRLQGAAIRNRRG